MSAGPLQRSLLKDLSSMMDLTHLQELILHDFDDEIFSSSKLRELCGPKLQRLRWKVEGNLHAATFRNTHQISLSISPPLRSLEVCLGVKSSVSSPIPWALQALRCLLTRHSKIVLLEDLTIRYLAEPTHFTYSEKMHQLWGGFDEVLSDLKVLPCLKRVLVISAWVNDNEIDPRTEHRLQKLYIGMILKSLPRLRARGVIFN
ncbi:hypothetical protein FPV67DRAFT_1102181 [Lyophyllum atratum]|nr:hypothetical protein FPV67DRAFT_1102181 [Lyophyllum atratum]